MDSVTKTIQIAVARADLIICTVLRWLGVLIPLAILFALIFLVVWHVKPDPYYIDYDAPGVDITSEGPEGDWTEEWYNWR